MKSKNIKQEFSISTSINNQENNTRFQIEEKKTQCNCETQSAFPALIIEISETFRLSITPHSKVNTTSENIQQHKVLKLKTKSSQFQHQSALSSQENNTCFQIEKTDKIKLHSDRGN